MGEHERHQRRAKNAAQYVKAGAGRHRNRAERGQRRGRAGWLPGQQQEGRVGKAEVAGDREGQPPLGDESVDAQQQDGQRKPEQLKAGNVDDVAEEIVAALEHREHLQVREPEPFVRRREGQRLGGQFGRQGGDEMCIRDSICRFANQSHSFVGAKASAWAASSAARVATNSAKGPRN